MSPAATVSSIGVRTETGPVPLVGQKAPERSAEAPTVGWPVDSVEFTGLTVSEAISRLEGPRLEAIRREIAAGTYLTEDKLNVVYDRLTEVLRRVKDENARASA